MQKNKKNKLFLKKPKEGIALLMVIMVLATLIIIASPFAISMKWDEKASSKFSEQMKARFLAESAKNHAIAHLYQSHKSLERKKLLQKLSSQNIKFPHGLIPPSPSENPFFDSEKELEILWPKAFGKDLLILKNGTRIYGKILSKNREKVVFLNENGSRKYSFFDIQSLVPSQISSLNSHGSMMAVQVEDEQGKIDLNTAHPYVIGVILGASKLLKSINAKDKIIPIANPREFYTDHNPKTVDGLLRIGSEYIAYRDIGTVQNKDGVTFPALKGCIRGLYFSQLSLQAGIHFANTFIYDARAMKIALHPIWSVPREYHPYQTVSQVREISNWSLLELRVELLQASGMSKDFLKKMNVGVKTLQKAGLSYEIFTSPKQDLSAKEKEIFFKLKQTKINMSNLKKLSKKKLQSFLHDLSKLSQKKLHKKMKDSRWIAQTNRQLQNKIRQKIRFQNNLKKYLPRSLKAMSELLQNVGSRDFHIETLGARETERLKKYFSVYPSRSSLWTNYFPLENRIKPHFSYRFSYAYIPFSPEVYPFGIVEINQNNQKEYAQIWNFQSFSRMDKTILTLFPSLKKNYRFHEAKIRWRTQPKINIMTASLPVLKAIFFGLQLRNSKDYISLREAEYLGRFIIQGRRNRAFQDWKSLASYILSSAKSSSAFYDMEYGYSKKDGQALLINSLSPNSPYLYRGTFGFCFSSGDVYTIQATGILNGLNGSPLASHRFKEILQLAPPVALQWIQDRQLDFTEKVKFTRKPLFLSGRKLQYLATFPEPPDTPQRRKTPWVFPSQVIGKGEIRFARIREPASDYFYQHFDENLIDWFNEGYLVIKPFPHKIPTRLESGGKQGLPMKMITLAMPEKKDSSDKEKDSSDKEKKKEPVSFPILSDGHVEFWFKPSQGHQKNRKKSQVLFYTRGISLAYLPEEAKLVLGVADGFGGGTALEAPFLFQKNKWYHIAFYWTGSNVGDLALFVDGQAIGKSTNVCYLRKKVGKEENIIQVDSAKNFPPTGTLRIGEEICDYVKIEKNQFFLTTKRIATKALDNKGKPLFKKIRAFRRGNNSHEKGTLVTPYGYVKHIQKEMKIGKASLLTKLPTPTPTLSLELTNPLDIPIPILKVSNSIPISSKYKIKAITIGLSSSGQAIVIQPTIQDFPSEGYLLIQGLVEISPSLPATFGSEVVFYSSIQGNMFTTVSRGEEGTYPSKFVTLTSIQLVSFKISDNTDYESNGKIQLYKKRGLSEWISYKKAKKRENFLLFGGSFTIGRDFGDNLICLEKQVVHYTGDLVMPIYKEEYSYSTFFSSGIMIKGDGLILYQRSEDGKSYFRENQQVARKIGNEFSFTEHLKNKYGTYENRFGQMGKWPSGTLHFNPSKYMLFGSSGVIDKMPSPPPIPKYDHFFLGTYDEIRIQKVRGKEEGVFPIPKIYGEFQKINTSKGVILLKSYGTKSQLDSLKSYLKDYPKAYNASKIKEIVKLLEEKYKNYEKASSPSWKDLIYWHLRPDQTYISYAGYDNFQLSSSRIQLMEKIKDGALIQHGGKFFYVKKMNKWILEVNDCDFKTQKTIPYPQGSHYLIPLEWPIVGTFVKKEFYTVQDRKISKVHIQISPKSSLQYLYSLPVPGYVFFQDPKGFSVLGYNKYQIKTYNSIQKRGKFIILEVNSLSKKQPLFNGAFGSHPFSWNKGTQAIFLPWRYFDRVAPLNHRKSTSFYQTSFRPEQSFFRRVWWESRASRGTFVRVKVRIDGKPDWNTPPGKIVHGSKIYEFTNPKKANLEIFGDQIEIKVSLEYKKGAFDLDLWKETPSFRRLGVEYFKNSRVLYHEELPK